MELIIKDKEGNVLGANALDREVCTLWEVEIRDRSYAMPNPRSDYPEGIRGEIDFCRQSNWFDTIGYAIASENLTNWSQVRAYFREMYKDILKKYNMTLEQLIPKMMMLIQHWEDKGYICN